MRKHHRRTTIILFLICGLVPLPAFSSPIVIGSHEVQDGIHHYTYTVTNNLEEPSFGFDLTPVMGLSAITVPNDGWSFIVTEDRIEFVAFDDGVEIPAGGSLSGFGFSSPFAPGESTYFVVTGSGGDFSGSVIGPVNVVPEPNSDVLMAIGLCVIGLLLFVRKRRGRRAFG